MGAGVGSGVVGAAVAIAVGVAVGGLGVAVVVTSGAAVRLGAGGVARRRGLARGTRSARSASVTRLV